MSLSKDSYIVFWDKTIDCMYGPYNHEYDRTIFPSIMNGNEIIVIYFEPYNLLSVGNFTIESVKSIDKYPYYQQSINHNYQEMVGDSLRNLIGHC